MIAEAGPVRTKSEFLELAASGRMGNQMPSWPSPEEAVASGYRGPVMIRYMEPNSPFMRPDIPMDEVPSEIVRLVALGAAREKLYLTHMTPSCGRRINGELWRSPSGLYLNYSTSQAHLRESLHESGRHAERSAAMAVLRATCDPDSVDDMLLLLDRHPDSVIEFTSYERPMGTIPGRTVVIWEVRNY
jgi:hypothetical protein